MPIFLKTERIKKKFLVNTQLTKEIIKKHVIWVKQLKQEGINIKSGFLIDQFKKPGGGGVLILECKTYKDAEKIIKNDPMIKNQIVTWKLFEWNDVLTEK